MGGQTGIRGVGRRLGAAQRAGLEAARMEVAAARGRSRVRDVAFEKDPLAAAAYDEELWVNACT